jgi:hypothetical protein
MQDWKAYPDCLWWTVLARRYAVARIRIPNNRSHKHRIHRDRLRSHWILGTIRCEQTGCV